MAAVPKCRIVTVHLFRGQRGAIQVRVRKALDDEKYGQGPGPTSLDCLLCAGHTGVSLDSDPKVIWGFNPNYGQDPLWLAMHNLRTGGAYPGHVTDDTQVFAAATQNGLSVLRFDVILPDPAYQVFEQ